jgi:hypothetical protein
MRRVNDLYQSGSNSTFHSRVPDVLRVAEIHDILGHVRRVVGDAFDAFRGDDPVEAAADRGGIFHHVLHERGVNLLVERVHFLVARDDGARGGGIAVHKRVERVLEHVERKGGDARQIEIDLHGRFERKVARALGDFGRFVANAFEVLRNFHGYGDEPEICRERCAGQKLDGKVVNLDFKLVNDPVVVLDAERKVGVALDERLHGLIDGGLGVTGHRQQFLLQRVESRFKMIFHKLFSK